MTWKLGELEELVGSEELRELEELAKLEKVRRVERVRSQGAQRQNKVRVGGG